MLGFCPTPIAVGPILGPSRAAISRVLRSAARARSIPVKRFLTTEVALVAGETISFRFTGLDTDPLRGLDETFLDGRWAVISSPGGKTYEIEKVTQ